MANAEVVELDYTGHRPSIERSSEVAALLSAFFGR